MTIAFMDEERDDKEVQQSKIRKTYNSMWFDNKNKVLNILFPQF